LPVSFTLLIGMAPALPQLIDAIQEIEVEATIEAASEFRLRIGIAQTALGDWSILELDLFRPLVPIQIRVQTGMGVPEAIINGYVTSQQIAYSDQPGQSVLEVTGMDATLLMNLQEKVMAWPNMPDSVIAAALFGQYTIVPQAQPTPPALIEPEGTTMQRSTDIRFLRRLARRNGFDCFVQPEALTGLDMGYFQPPTLVGLPQAVLSVNMGELSNVAGFNVHYDMLRPTTAVASSLDIATKSPQPAVAPVALQIPLGLEGTLMRVIPPPIVRPAETAQMRSPELQAVAQGIVDQSTWAVIAEGQVGSDLGVLRPGKIVNVRGAGRVFNGSYYVTRVMHSITKENYVQKFQAKRNAVGMTGAELYVSL
jgi:Phage tail baseplate hub (GPD)